MDDGVSADGLLERSAQTPTAPGRGHERGVDGGCSRLAPQCGERRDQVTRDSTHMARRRRDSPPTPRPQLGQQTDRDEPCGRGWGVPGTSLHVRSPSCRHAFASGGPPKTRGEESGSRSPASPIVTDSRIGPMPERISLNLVDSSPIMIATPTSPRDAHTQASLAARPSGLLRPRPRTVVADRRAETASAVRESAR
jgi:hypothetical protein